MLSSSPLPLHPFLEFLMTHFFLSINVHLFITAKCHHWAIMFSYKRLLPWTSWDLGLPNQARQLFCILWILERLVPAWVLPHRLCGHCHRLHLKPFSRHLKIRVNYFHWVLWNKGTIVVYSPEELNSYNNYPSRKASVCAYLFILSLCCIMRSWNET